MEQQFLKVCHDDYGHLSKEKTIDIIRRTYWFSDIARKANKYIRTCPKCISYNVPTGKLEGFLHPIPKGNKPFDCVHIDYYGPLEPAKYKRKFILVVIDGFSKFIKLYPTKGPTADESIKCVKHYFTHYSRPIKLISDRGSCFTAGKFLDFMRDQNIHHILVASGCPRVNGQVERTNRTIGPMIAKSVDYENNVKWDDVLDKVEFAINNSINKSTKETPCKLLFGINQRGEVNDKIKEYLENYVFDEDYEELDGLRVNAAENIKKTQEYNQNYYNQSR